MANERPLSILVVDDNRSSADALARLLRKRGDEVRATYDGETAIGLIEELTPDLVLTDLKMEPVDGLVVLKAARSQRPPIETIVFTAYGAVEVAVRAMHLGARDFLTKPVTVEQLSARIDQIRTGDDHGAGFVATDGFQADSEAARDLWSLLQRAAGVPTPGVDRGGTRRWTKLCGTRPPPSGRRSPRGRDAVHDPQCGPGRGLARRRERCSCPTSTSLPDGQQRELYVQLQDAPAGVRVAATALPERTPEALPRGCCGPSCTTTSPCWW